MYVEQIKKFYLNLHAQNFINYNIQIQFQREKKTMFTISKYK